MRFNYLRAKGFIPFPDEIEIDFSKIDGTLVAITGLNGAGKSTLLELLAAGMYRECPTRGPLAKLATARDTFLEVGLVNGASHRIRQSVDYSTGKGESLVTDAAGRSVLDSTKVSSFDKWAAKHLPSSEVLYASTFSPQKSHGFLDMSATDRKGLLLKVLGIERYEALAEKAREHVRAAKGEVTVLDARLADERSRASDPNAVRAELDALQVTLEEQQRAVTIAKGELNVAIAADADYQTAARVIEERRRKIDDVERRLRAAREKKADLDKRTANNERVLAQHDEIDAAKAAAEKLDTEIEELSRAATATQSADATARAERTAAREAESAARAATEQAIQRRDRLKSRVADKATVEAAGAEVVRLQQAKTVGEAQVSATEFKIRETSDLLINGAALRIEGLRGGLSHILEVDGSTAAAAARVALDDDHALAADAASAPMGIEHLRADLAEQKAALGATTRDLAQAEKTASRGPEIARAEADLTKATDECNDLAKVEIAARDRFAAAAAVASAAMDARDKATEEHDAKKLERAKLDPLLKRAEPLAQAEARLSELRPQIDAVVTELTTLEAERAELGEPGAPPAAPGVDRARGRLDTAERALRGTEAAIAVKETHLTEAHAAAERIAAIIADRDVVLARVADWTLIADSLGRDGLQAMEIDAAGPRLTEIANQLLHDAFGPRFTIRFDLSRKSADGKKDIEGLDVSVIDTEKGREGDAETLSGGEGVIISEAISLALTTIACARSGVERPTLIRDESGAALDVTRAPAYVRMLRRAAQLIGADKVLLVSHSPAVWDLCDARIEIADGKVSVAA